MVNHSHIDAVLYFMKFFYKGILEKEGNGKYTSYKYTDTYVAEKIRLERMTEKSLLPSI